LLDALIDLPLEDALREVSVVPAIRRPLVGAAPEHDVFRKVYELARRYEVGDYDAVAALACDLKLPVSMIAAAYAESTLWAHGALRRAERPARVSA
jgi:hypothetical protein